MTLKTLAIVGLALAAVPALAQDISSPYDNAIADGARIHMDGVLRDRMIRQNRANVPNTGVQSRPAVEARARATCADKQRIASRLSPAKARQLYSLCAQAGF